MSRRVEDRDAEAFEWAAHDLFEAMRGQGSWRKARTPERSQARLLVRTVLAAFEKRGWTFDDRTGGKAPARPAGHR